MTVTNIRNIAIVAHVDHGKTTLVDCLLSQTGALEGDLQRAMDSNDLERERGITILSKNTSIEHNGVKINIVDTPGHADFGGEVERILSMVDAVLLVVDAVEGPMPQTRFVTSKAFEYGLKPLVVLNKIDRDGIRIDDVIEEVFDLFDDLGANDEQLDFDVVYCSAMEGTSGQDIEHITPNMDPLLDKIIETVNAPNVDLEAPFQMQISSLDYSEYEGVIGLGLIKRGAIEKGKPITLITREGDERSGRIANIYLNKGLERFRVESAHAGDIVCITGIDGINISDTLCDVAAVEALPALNVDEPTLTMMFCVNDSPFAGNDGKYLTSRQIRERLFTESLHNVALSVVETEDPDRFEVSGRGELHLSVLIETMRREGYELLVSRPKVIERVVDGVRQEPFETVVLDIGIEQQGKVIESLTERRGELLEIEVGQGDRVRLTFKVSSRGLMGFRSSFLSLTSGEGLMSFAGAGFGPRISGDLGSRQNGVLISNTNGKAVGYALFNLQARGRLFVEPGDLIYEGMVVGLHSRSNDLTVNPAKEKKLTNVRASGSDEAIDLNAPVKMSLEQSLEFIDEDEFVEVTPSAVRIRKKLLKEYERKRVN